MTPDPLLIRADASASIGTGHIMRCLALAQAWQDAGGCALFVAVSFTPALKERLSSESFDLIPVSAEAGSLEDAQETIRIASSRQVKWIVVDGYHFEREYQQALKAAGFKVLFLDDYGHSKSYSADLVLNQNLSASEKLYSDRGPQTQLLLGPKYALLRREFSNWVDWKRIVEPDCRQLLVLMGGSDPSNVTARALEALSRRNFDRLAVKVILGGSNPHISELKRCATASSVNIELLTDVYRLSDLMARADIAISAAGSTCWELCLLGVPSLFVDVADNQTANARELDRLRCAIHVGNGTVTATDIANGLISLANSESIRRELSENSRRLVDGKGALRVLSALTGQPGVFVRPATAGDQKLIWEWANDPQVRAASFSTEPISWETHVAWFAEKLADRDTHLLIVETVDDQPVGQIRFDVIGQEADAHISLVKGKRGTGLAVPAIQAALRRLFSRCDCECVHAYVKPENAASIRVFEKAGFERLDMKTVKGKSALHFRRARN